MFLLLGIHHKNTPDCSSPAHSQEGLLFMTGLWPAPGSWAFGMFWLRKVFCLPEVLGHMVPVCLDSPAGAMCQRNWPIIKTLANQTQVRYCCVSLLKELSTPVWLHWEGTPGSWCLVFSELCPVSFLPLAFYSGFFHFHKL